MDAWATFLSSDSRIYCINWDEIQAKENADELVTQKKELDALKEKKLKESKEHEIAMRIRASNVGNIVGNAVPVSLTEVGYFYYL